jgi:FkbM family methyltransferase
MSLILRAYSTLFARPSARRLNYFLFDCAIRGLGILNHHTQSESGEAHFIRDFLPRHLPQEPVIFDVGANVGDYTALLRGQFPRAHIHSFEPNPEAFAKLQSQESAFTKCQAFGFSNAPGEFDLFEGTQTESSPHASLHREVITTLHAQSSRAIRVKMKTLDDYLAQQHLDRVDFLKIDTEGNELAALQGARNALAAQQIGIIQFEFNEMNVVSRCFLRDFRLLLPRHKLFRLLPSGMIKIPQSSVRSELFAFQNVIALPTTLVS